MGWIDNGCCICFNILSPLKRTDLIKSTARFLITGALLIIEALISCNENNLAHIENAFRKTPFEPGPFNNSEYLANFTQFLLTSDDTIIAYNQHEYSRQIQLSEDSFTSHYNKTGNCFHLVTFREEFLKEYIPPYLVDSLTSYLTRTEVNFIKGIKLCNKKSKQLLIIRLKGDGKKYQFRIKDDIRSYYSYISTFSTSGEWQEIEIPLNEMYPSFRGRRLNLPNFSQDNIEEIAFLIGNKKPESFRLLIDKIELL